MPERDEAAGIASDDVRECGARIVPVSEAKAVARGPAAQKRMKLRMRRPIIKMTFVPANQNSVSP